VQEHRIYSLGRVPSPLTAGKDVAGEEGRDPRRRLRKAREGRRLRREGTLEESQLINFYPHSKVEAATVVERSVTGTHAGWISHNLF
jgi:hypothetical protein